MLQSSFVSQTRRILGGWTFLTMIIAGLVLAPVLSILSSLLADERQVWAHLASTVLARYLLNTLWLTLGVGSGVLVLGIGTAWLVTMCQFAGRRWLEWGLLLPLAAPTYVLAYTYTDFLQVTGPVQALLRQWTGWSVGSYWFPEIRSLGGAIALLVLTLYPYVYLAARVAFQEQSVACLEVSRSLGLGPWQSFLWVAVPLARPAIMAGLALALMETLNDFGTVQYFGVDTFTTGIYRTWFGLNEPVAAAQLAGVLVMLVLGLILLEQVSRRRARYYRHAITSDPSRYALGLWAGLGANLACLLPIGLGFALPAGVLARMTLATFSETVDARFWNFARNSLLLAAVTAGLGVLLALVVCYGLRLQPNLALRWAAQVAAMGYALPGAVIAVGVLIPVGHLDNAIDAWAQAWLNRPTGLLLSGTITALVFAYLVRFLAVALGTVEASLNRIRPSLDEAARSLGQGSFGTLTRIHLPLLRGGLLSAALLVFVDVMKELPATLVMRPFNFDTLAVRTYQMAADERLAEAGTPALAIVLVGILPVILLNRKISS